MSCKIQFTCVPIGKKGDLACLDVLVTPQCDSTSHATDLTYWQSTIVRCADKFKLALGSDAPLTLDTSKIQMGLWYELLGGAGVNAPSTTAPHRSISPGGVSLSTTHTLVHDFYKNAALSRMISDDKHGPDRTFLQNLHQIAVDTHGLYQPPTTQTPSAPTNLRATTATVNTPLASIRMMDAASTVLAAIPIGDHSADAETLIRNKFAVNVVSPGGGRYALAVNGPKVDIPARAMLALAHLKYEITNNLRKADGQTLLPPPAAEKPLHLVYHVNRLLASTKGRKAAHAKKVARSIINRPDVDFNQRITLLLNMPAILEALGLVLHFTFPFDKLTPCGPTGRQVQLKVDQIADLSSLGALITPITISNEAFLPKPRPDLKNVRADGWINSADGYHVGSLQLDSAAMQIMQFANQAGLRQVAQQEQLARGVTPPSPLVHAYDEDVEHPVLPPSPHTAGLHVWQDDLQQRVDDARNRAAAPSAGTASQPLYAEDLKNGVVVDVLAIDPESKKKTWIHLCSRKEVYKISHFVLDTPNCDRAVRTASAKPIDTGIASSLSHEVDETVFTWRLGSLVTKPGIPRKKPPSTERIVPKDALPWPQLGPPETEPTEPIPSPLFGWEYQVSMRASFVTGGVVSFDPTAAALAATPPQVLQRYELIQGPELIPVTSNKNYFTAENKTLMMIGSRISDKISVSPYCNLSQRVLVPAQVAPDVARRHGKAEQLIVRGARILPLEDGSLPKVIEDPDDLPDESTGIYLPDPLCTGITAILTDLKGVALGSVSVDVDGDDWPDYTPHFIELRRPEDAPDRHKPISVAAITNGSSFPFLTDNSRAVVCTVPPGETRLLILRPQLAPETIGQHAFGRATALGGNPSVVKLALTDMCRPTVIRLTHATDRPTQCPRTDPSSSTPIAVDRTKPVLLGANVEPQSTSKVALIGEWKEVSDDLRQASSSNKSMTAQLSEFHCSKNSDGKIAAQKIQLPFSDAKYRQLRVTARGIGRYVDAFPDRDIYLEGDPLAIDLLATSPPAAPDVEYILPNLKWDIADGHRTRTLGLTVVLNRPWYSSGEAEKLALITAAVPTAKADIVDSIGTSFGQSLAENEVSAWGVMPDWVFAANNVDPSTRIKIETERSVVGPPPTTPAAAIIPFGNKLYSALLYSPLYNEQDQQWYVNLSLARPPAYGAVVRLLLARYQRFALDGMQLSPIQACDFSLLGPERSIHLIRSGFFHRKKKIQITGVGAYAMSKDNSAGKRLVTEFEVRHIEVNTQNKTEFNWEEGDVVPMDRGFQTSGEVLWQGSLDQIVPGGMLIAREREIYPCAEDPSNDGCRWVYLDAIPL